MENGLYIRIQIARFQGLQKVERCTKELEPKEDGVTARHLVSNERGVQHYREVPNYFNSLDAIHEARKSLDEKQKKRFVFALAEVVGVAAFSAYLEDQYALIDATAGQQVEAFITTIRL